MSLLGDFAYFLSVTSCTPSLEVYASSITGAGFVHFDGSAQTRGGMTFTDSIGNDTLIGGTRGDLFFAYQSGSDTFDGGGGVDRFDLSNSFDVTDRIDGGAGNDVLQVQINSAVVALHALTIRNIEKLEIQDGWTDAFKIATDDANVAAGRQLEVATPFGRGGRYEFDGSAETDGSFKFVEAIGNDILTGGAQADHFVMSYRGNDVLAGGGGNDIYHVNAGFTAEDQLAGGGGSGDTIYMSQDLAAGMVLDAQTITGIETISFAAGHSYALIAHDANVGAADRLRLDGQLLGVSDIMRFDGSAETDGSFTLLGGAAADFLRGGSMNDRLTGGAGSDRLIGRRRSRYCDRRTWH